MLIGHKKLEKRLFFLKMQRPVIAQTIVFTVRNRHVEGFHEILR